MTPSPWCEAADLPPEGDDLELWHSLCVLARCHPELVEIKRP
jgi:hypothetical protein